MEEMFTFIVTDDNGEEVECQVLFTFESEETGKNYIVFTDGEIDEEDGCTKVYANVIEYGDDGENQQRQQHDDRLDSVAILLAHNCSLQRNRAGANHSGPAQVTYLLHGASAAQSAASG